MLVSERTDETLAMTRYLYGYVVSGWLAECQRSAVESRRAVRHSCGQKRRLKAVGQPTDGPGLVEFFRTRAQTEMAPEKIAVLIKQLNASVLKEREKACAELIAIGPPALPQLRRAAKDVDDADASALAQRCLGALDGGTASLTGAAARLLAVRHPAGLPVETLLAFLSVRGK